jgi:glycosyltransferase involved in cell wall biosynthesis
MQDACAPSNIMKVLLLNQCFYPDVVSTAQHLTDLAVELAAANHEVTVVASSRGYDDPEKRFSKRETWKGVSIRRIACTGLGKRNRWTRALDFGSFLLSCAFRVIFLPKSDLVVAMTSPPLISFLAAVLVRLKGGRFVFWVMDLNPDEAIAAGWLRKRSATAKFLDALLSYSVKRAEKIIVLDRFVKQRIIDKGIAAEKVLVIPPWSHDDAISYDERGRLEFRARHNLDKKFVVMYSGNHSPCHPLDTLLEAARQLANNDKIVFCFAGGGSEMGKVRLSIARHHLTNVLCLGYQPLDKLAGSLSAADMHVVVMGEGFVGIVHPCKIYNILEVGAPVLYIGPADSHVSDIFSTIADRSVTFRASHGDVDGVVRRILEAASRSVDSPFPRVRRSAAVAFSKRAILPRLIEALRPARNLPAVSESVIAEAEAPGFQERIY